MCKSLLMGIYQTANEKSIIKFARKPNKFARLDFLCNFILLNLQEMPCILDIFIANTIKFTIKLESAKLIDNNEPIIERLKELKEKSGLTVSKIAKNSNGELTESTINRILMGKTKNPTITTVIQLAKAMGFKATDPFDETFKVDVQAETPQVVVPTVDVNVYNQMIQMYKDIIATKEQTYNENIRTKNRWIRILFCLLIFFVILAAVFIGVYLSSGEFGLIRY